jgi:diphthamide biosynthesis methyltransferase
MAGAGKVKYLPPRFMTVNTAIKQLLEMEADKNEVAWEIYRGGAVC